jgi:hypothetical protein
MYPKYKVSWIWNRVCAACGTVNKEQNTWAFFTPEAAMDQALFIMQHPEYVLLFVEQ